MKAVEILKKRRCYQAKIWCQKDRCLQLICKGEEKDGSDEVFFKCKIILLINS